MRLGGSASSSDGVTLDALICCATSSSVCDPQSPRTAHRERRSEAATRTRDLGRHPTVLAEGWSAEAAAPGLRVPASPTRRCSHRRVPQRVLARQVPRSRRGAVQVRSIGLQYQRYGSEFSQVQAGAPWSDGQGVRPVENRPQRRRAHGCVEPRPDRLIRKCRSQSAANRLTTPVTGSCSSGLSPTGPIVGMASV